MMTRIALTLLSVDFMAEPACCGSFSFNKADTAKMVHACEEEGVKLPGAVAEAIVAARAHRRFLRAEDLLELPGMTEELLKELDPIEEDNDLVFNPSALPGMRSY